MELVPARLSNMLPTPSYSAHEQDGVSSESSQQMDQDTEIDALRARVVDLEKRLAERGQLVRKSEALRAELSKEVHELRKVNEQLRYLATPSPFESSFAVRVKGTPPSNKVSVYE